MQIRDKIITAACLYSDGLEWTSIKVKQDGNETIEQSSLPMDISQDVMADLELNVDLHDKLQGDLTVAIKTSELLMRTMEFPTSDPVEIAGMVNFQIDKVSPFPLDQLAVSHEIVRETENGALVLMMAAKHECIDAIGDLFAHKGVHIRSIDARLLGWLNLLEKGHHLTGNECEILVIDDGIDYALAILSNKVPITFRSLPEPEDEKAMAEELAHEIEYTLTTLDTDYDLAPPESIEIWSRSHFPTACIPALKTRTGMTVRQNALSSLPPLSEGILDRTVHLKSRIELIPREWIEHQRLMRLKKRFIFSSSVMGAIWLAFMLLFTVIYQTRAVALRRVQKKEASLAPLANQAIENRQKLRALKGYADRSDSALECLREATSMLPAGDIEFVVFNYNKNKGVTLRGTAESRDLVYQYTDALADSELFVKLKDERINTKMTKGVERALFNATLELPSEEED